MENPDDDPSLTKFHVWLSDLPQRDGEVFVLRSAFRVFPVFAGALDEEWAVKHGFDALPILRALLTAQVLRQCNTSDVGKSVVDVVASASKMIEVATYGRSLSGRDAGNGGLFAIDAVNGTVRTDPLRNPNRLAYGISRSELAFDRDLLEKGIDPLTQPLWRDYKPDRIASAEANMHRIWASDPETYWEFWQRWYQSLQLGKRMHCALLTEIALIPNEHWEKGIGHIAGVIAGIELQHAIAATPNGEDIVADPQTGLLQIVAVTDLPTDIATYARRKIIRATEVFGASPENQYAALPADLDMLRAVVADPEATPVELFDACASASRRLRARIDQGSCPAADKDPLIDDYGTRIRDAGADILANDPQTQNVLTARNAIGNNNAMQEGAADIAKLVDMMQPLTTGRLTLVLSSDADVSANPKADPDDRKDASIRLSSRVLRIGKVLVTCTVAGAATVIGAKEVLEAIPIILASPYYQAAMGWILKFLGF